MAEAGQPEESMEDILQSIKRIIEDEPADDAAAQPDVLDLTQVVKEETAAPVLPPAQDVIKSIDTMLAPPEPAPKPKPTPTPTPTPAPKPAEKPAAAAAPAAKPKAMEDGLVSDQAAHAAAAALKPIVESAHKDYSVPHIPSPGLRNGNTVEDLILESLRPMLKAWLDEHLPMIVQKIVEKEVKRIVTFHQD